MATLQNTNMLLHHTSGAPQHGGGVIHVTRVPAPPAHTAPATHTVPAAHNPVQAGTIVQHSANVATVSQSALIWRGSVSGQWLQQGAKPRSGFASPTLIAPTPSPSDTTLFEEPQNAGAHHYLPGYTIATQGAGASLAKRVSFAQTATGWALTVHLAASPAPGGVAATAIVATNTRYILSAVLDSRSVSWDFTTATPGPGTLTLSLAITTLPDRDSVYRAMTNSASGAKLIVRRTFPFASLVPPNPAQPGTFYRSNPSAIDTAIPFTFDIALYSYVFAQMGSAPGSAPAWQKRSIPWNERSFDYYFDSSQLTEVYYLPDAFRISRRSTAPHTPTISITSSGDDANSQVYTLSFLAVPIWDPKRISAAAAQFQNEPGMSSAPTMALFDAHDKSLSLNLPGDAASAPGLVPIPGASIDTGAGVSASVVLSLAQLQRVFAALFDDVSTLLSGAVTINVSQGGMTDVVTIPLSARVSEFTGNIFNITSKFEPAFNRFSQTLTNAIESPIHVDSLTGVLMAGDVIVPTNSQEVTPTLPADILPASDSAAAAAATGADTSGRATQPGSGGSSEAGTAVSTASTIASTVLAQTGHGAGNGALGSIFSSIGDVLSGLGDHSAVGAGDGPATQPPDVLVFSVSPSSGSKLSESCTVLYDFSNTHVHGKPEAIWDAIMQNQVLGPVKRKISIGVIAAIFAAPAVTAPAGDNSQPTPAPEPIHALQVVFRNGQTASFDASTTTDSSGNMTQVVELSAPVKAFVLGVGDLSNYEYCVKTIRESGTKTSEWKTSNVDSFFVDVEVDV